MTETYREYAHCTLRSTLKQQPERLIAMQYVPDQAGHNSFIFFLSSSLLSCHSMAHNGPRQECGQSGQHFFRRESLIENDKRMAK